MSDDPMGAAEGPRTGPLPEDAEPAPLARKKSKLPRLLWHFLITFFVLNALSLVLGHETRVTLKSWNDALVEGVESVDPFRIGKDYWNYVVHNDRSFMPKPQVNGLAIPSKAEPARGPLQRIVDTFVRAVVGVVVVAAHGAASGGAVSMVVSVLAILLAFLFVTDLGHDIGIIHWVLIPFVASVFVFLLIALIRLVGLVFGGVFVAAQAIAAIEGTLIGMTWKVVEHEAVGKLITRLTRRVR